MARSLAYGSRTHHHFGRNINETEEQLMSENSPVPNSQQPDEIQQPLLPRSAWDSQVTYLRTLFRVKKALDLIEQEAGVVRF